MPRKLDDTPLRIAFIIPHLERGGVPVVVIDLSNELSRRGYSVDLLALDATGPLKDRASDAVRIIDLACHRARYALPRLLKYMIAAKPDVMIGVVPHVNVLVILASLLMVFGRPRVIATEQAALRASSTTWRDRVLLFLLRAAYRVPSKVVCCSEGIRRELIEELGLPERQVETIHNAVVGPQALADLERPAEDPWLTASKDPIIVTVGRLHPQKDQETLLRAFAKVVERRPARLLILGEGEDRAALEALAAELGISQRVHLPGYVFDSLAQMKAADLFVLSSRFEGLPTVLIEALLCGLPIVSTDCEHGPREILQDGRYGTLIPVGDVAALAAAMLRALAAAPDPEGQRRRAMEFTVAQAASRYEALFGDDRDSAVHHAERTCGPSAG